VKAADLMVAVGERLRVWLIGGWAKAVARRLVANKRVVTSLGILQENNNRLTSELLIIKNRYIYYSNYRFKRKEYHFNPYKKAILQY
jgi:hypothetical protein